MKIGFDLDGVLCNVSITQIVLLNEIPDEKLRNYAKLWYYRERKPLLDARLLLKHDDEMYIITSRDKEFTDVTERWVKHYYPKAKLTVLGQDEMEGNGELKARDYCKEKVEMKAQKINELGVEVYFDDEAEWFDDFRELCPNCKIIKYGGRLKI